MYTTEVIQQKLTALSTNLTLGENQQLVHYHMAQNFDGSKFGRLLDKTF